MNRTNLARLVAGTAVLIVVPAAPAAATAVPIQLPILHPATRVTATSATDTVADKTATVTCPAGTQVAGAGVLLAPNAWLAAPTEIRPHPDLTAVTVAAHGSSTTAWALTAVGVCARPRSTHLRVTGTASGAGYTRTAVAQCPAGTEAIGTGFQLTGEPVDVKVNQVRPSPELSRVSVTAYGQTSPAWGLQAYAVCSSVDAVRITPPTAGARAVAGAGGCPPGSSVNGVGAQAGDGSGDPSTRGWITELAADPDLAGATATVDGTPDYWYSDEIDEYAICVPDA